MDPSTITAKEIILCVFFGICFAAYIVALIRTRKKQMATFVNWPEFSGSMLGCVATLVGTLMLLYSEETWVGIAVLLSGLAIVILSARFCLRANNGNVLNVIIATLAKFFVVLISCLSILYIFRNKNKESIAASRAKNSIAITIAAFLIFSLVGTGKHEKLVETAKDVAPVF